MIASQLPGLPAYKGLKGLGFIEFIEFLGFIGLMIRKQIESFITKSRKNETTKKTMKSWRLS